MDTVIRYSSAISVPTSVSRQPLVGNIGCKSALLAACFALIAATGCDQKSVGANRGVAVAVKSEVAADTSAGGHESTATSRRNVHVDEKVQFAAHSVVSKDSPASASVVEPEWVQDAVFYQIFPERFCNGDASND